jgi:hypothetical protein
MSRVEPKGRTDGRWRCVGPGSCRVWRRPRRITAPRGGQAQVSQQADLGAVPRPAPVAVAVAFERGAPSLQGPNHLSAVRPPRVPPWPRGWRRPGSGWGLRAIFRPLPAGWEPALSASIAARSTSIGLPVRPSGAEACGRLPLSERHITRAAPPTHPRRRRPAPNSGWRDRSVLGSGPFRPGLPWVPDLEAPCVASVLPSV